MPELPEVETIRRGLEPHLVGRRVRRLLVREPRLRWPVAPELERRLRGARILQLSRRAKYLLFHTDRGTLIVHLGMSGSLRIIRERAAPGPHDHVELRLDDDGLLRYTDPRRFGAWLWTEAPAEKHPLLARLGPEPLGNDFSGDRLFQAARGRTRSIKSFLMDSHIVAGIGNIYANEALFMAAIHPARAAGRIGLARYRRLAGAVHEVLQQAIACGGTTLRDFVDGDGRPGYFRQSLQVYGRGGQSCPRCAAAIRETRSGQRSTFYCPRCQH
ncbi:MAG TPA: bifunctional DNA-formamidopyrimidine glycosylase/DNA-(apurinic or apyrimidinic site) lyase [Gammaproteobacteria bacterium]|nr:bifunctional DNA-formamidopyrimidine glycosylase/DNA-(apurinic or apyrimidinic site) lyase [Gammaproteobacteria bacterium]